MKEKSNVGNNVANNNFFACFVLAKLIPKVTKAHKEQEEKMKRLNERIKVMVQGVGGFILVEHPSE